MKLFKFLLACAGSLPMLYVAQVGTWSVWRWKKYDYWEDWLVGVVAYTAALLGTLAVWAVVYRERENPYE